MAIAKPLRAGFDLSVRPARLSFAFAIVAHRVPATGVYRLSRPTTEAGCNWTYLIDNATGLRAEMSA
jgi:hypothetical protein